MELKVGDKVSGRDRFMEWTGIIYEINEPYATVKRDDGQTGSGNQIPDYGNGSNRGWLITRKRDGTWGCNEQNGTLILLTKRKSKGMLSYLQIAKALKQKGFTHIKLEFEADVNGEADDDEIECDDCGGCGNYEDDDGYEHECSNCSGEGHFHDNGHIYESVGNYFQNLISDIKTDYFEPYHDGSVNTEVTMTMSVDYIKDIERIVKSFHESCKHYDDNYSVSNAGFHISLLTSGCYPTRTELDYDKISNFKRNVEQLVGAMIPLCSKTGLETRSFEYRYPKVSSDDKYSAIYTHNDTCLEYRIFDTCYDRPKAMKRYLNVIVKTLGYYSKTKKTQAKKIHIQEQKNTTMMYLPTDDVELVNQLKEFYNDDVHKFGEIVKQFQDHIIGRKDLFKLLCK